MLKDLLVQAFARRSRVLFALTASSFVLIHFAGCGDGNASRVSGVVKLGGRPVGPGSLVFEPADLTSASAPSAVAQFAEDGLYSVRGPGNREVTPPGEYIVTIKGNAPGTAGNEGVDPNFKTEIPARYKLRDNGIKVTVQPGDNTIDLNLEP